MKSGKWALKTLGLLSIAAGIANGQQPEPKRIQFLPTEQAERAILKGTTGSRRGGLTIMESPSAQTRETLPSRYSRERFQLSGAEPRGSQPQFAPDDRGTVQRAAFETLQSPSGPQNSGVIHAEFQPEEPTASGAAPNPIRTVGATVPAESSPSTDPASEFAPPIPNPTLPAAFPDAPAGNAVAPLMETPISNAAQTPMVSIEWVRKSDINVGQECLCDLVIKNTGKVAARDVQVEAHFPQTVRLTQASPQPRTAKSSVAWDFATLAPGETQTIEIRMIPMQRGPLATTADVRFTGTAATSFEVEEPLLKIALEGPQEVFVGEPATQTITISNPGSGMARNVNIEAMIPAGLEHPRGERLAMDVGSLSPGESRRVRLSLVAVQGGEQTIVVRATGDAHLVEVTRSNIQVVAPSLKLAIDGPSLRYVGRSAKFDLIVSNDGQITSNNVRARYKVPEGYEFVRAGSGGKFDAATGTIDWFIGGLEPQKSVTVSVELKSEQLGEFTHQAVAFSEHGARSSAELSSRVDGSAALVLEIQDGNDPIEVGARTTYEVRVTNKGTKAAGDVGLSCELPNAVEYLAAEGPAEHIAENGLVVFKSLPRVAPGQTATFKIHVRGASEGNHRFRARLASQSIREPLIFEELTKFYSE